MEAMEDSESRSAPLRCLREPTLKVLSAGLDPRKVITSPSGLSRDWSGLAAAARLPYEKIPVLASADSPTLATVRLWIERDSENVANVDLLRRILADIDRYDVLEDVDPLIEADVTHYLDNNRRIVPSGVRNYNASSDENILTVDDVRWNSNGINEVQTYDAFILYADRDQDFAITLIQYLENNGFKLCDKYRDLLGGLSSHTAILNLIAERCNRLIVILSPDFFESPANKFFMNFAQALGIDQDRRKILPCVYKACDLPPHLSCYFALYYERSGRLYNFWNKLEDSLRATPQTRADYRGMIIQEIESQASSLRMLPGAISNGTYESFQNLSTPPTITITPSQIVVPDSSKTVSTSMIDLNVSKNEDILKMQDFVKGSSRSVNTIGGENLSSERCDSQTGKKAKWFSKFLHFNSSSRIEMCNQNPDTKKKNKKKWNFKKSIALSAN